MVNKIKSIINLVLVLSLIFIIPMNVAYSAGAIETRAGAAASFCGPVNVQDSLVLSILTLCLGGILKKTEEWRQIKCQAIICHYEAVKHQLDPSFCKAQESFLTCSYIIGDLFAIPPLSALEHLRQAVANLLANPVGTLWGASAKVARTSLQNCAPNCDSMAYGAQAIFLGVTDIAGVVQTVQEMLENGFFAEESADACDQVKDIRREMQEILGLEVDEEDEGLLGGII